MLLKKQLKILYGRLSNHRRITRPRKRFAKRDLKRKLASMSLKRITRTQKDEIRVFWSAYPVKIDYKWFDIYNTLNHNFDLRYYIPHDIYYCLVDPFFSNVIKSGYCDDKNMYDLLFHDVRQPETVVRIDNMGVCMDAGYRILTEEEAVRLCVSRKYVIIKPSVDCEGGYGIEFWDEKVDTPEQLVHLFTTRKNRIVSEVVRQHKTLARIHPESINTIRIMTLMIHDRVYILSAILRMGVGSSKVDNASSGGIFCGIDDQGNLKEKAYDVNGRMYRKHPQGETFAGCSIPNFDSCKELVQRLAPRLTNISKLCSWDIAISEDGNPILIETNMSYGQIDFHQMCNGPIFGDLTPMVLDTVFKK